MPDMTQTPIRIGFALDLPADGRRRIAAACPAGTSLEFLPEDFGDRAALGDIDALVVGTQPVPEAILDVAPRLRLIQRWGTGRDNIDLAAMKRRNITTAELPGVNARSVSEFLLLAILAGLRHLPDVAVAWSRGEWDAGRADFPPRRLTGKTVGLLGFGAIGRDLAVLLAPFDATILFHDLRAPERPLPSVVGPLGKDEVLTRSDIVCVLLPANAQTHRSVGVVEIAKMKPGAILVSIARAEIVDEAAARTAVRSGHLAAASFDNFTQEPLPSAAIAHQPGVLATPHIGGATIEGFDALAAACFANIAAILHSRS